MKPYAMIIPAAIAAVIALPAAHAATVTSLTVTGGSFSVSGGAGTDYTFPGGNLVAGAVNPVLTFNLVDPFNAANQGLAWGYTTAASSATVDEAAGTIQLTIPTFRWDWNATPLCTVKDCEQPQQPPGGVAAGSWNPTTQAYSVSWNYQWVTGQHPFPNQVTSWTLQGVATTPPPDPIPEPATYGLLAAGLVALVGITRRRAPRR